MDEMREGRLEFPEAAPLVNYEANHQHEDVLSHSWKIENHVPRFTISRPICRHIFDAYTGPGEMISDHLVLFAAPI